MTQQNNEKESEIQLLKEQIDQIKIKLQSLPQNKEEKMNNQYKDLFIQCQNLLDLNETKIHSLEEEISKLKREKIKYESNNIDENDTLNQQIQELKQKTKKMKQKFNSIKNKKTMKINNYYCQSTNK